MKRFWTEATAVPADGGWTVMLDGKPVRTPQRAVLVLPNAEMANAIAQEWQAIDSVRPEHQPLCALANAAIDLVAPDISAFAASLALYAESDLTCYRTDAPVSLVARQAAIWEPPLKAVEARHGLLFRRTSGVMHVAQPQASLAGVNALFRALDPYRLAALQPIISISGSAVLAIALLDGLLTTEAVFAAATLDEIWQEEQWGADDDAIMVRAARQRQFEAASAFLSLASAGAE